MKYTFPIIATHGMTYKAPSTRDARLPIVIQAEPRNIRDSALLSSTKSVSISGTVVNSSATIIGASANVSASSAKASGRTLGSDTVIVSLAGLTTGATSISLAGSSDCNCTSAAASSIASLATDLGVSSRTNVSATWCTLIVDTPSGRVTTSATECDCVGVVVASDVTFSSSRASKMSSIVAPLRRAANSSNVMSRRNGDSSYWGDFSSAMLTVPLSFIKKWRYTDSNCDLRLRRSLFYPVEL